MRRLLIVSPTRAPLKLPDKQRARTSPCLRERRSLPLVTLKYERLCLEVVRAAGRDRVWGERA